ncbi:hypothetical protein D3C81_1461690 [compost metagenome]
MLIQPFGTLLQLLFQAVNGLCQQGAGFNLALLQLFFALLQLSALVVIQQCGAEAGFVAEFTGGQCLQPLLLRLLQPLGLLQQLLLQPGQLAAQPIALLLGFLPLFGRLLAGLLAGRLAGA